MANIRYKGVSFLDSDFSFKEAKKLNPKITESEYQKILNPKWEPKKIEKKVISEKKETKEDKKKLSNK